MLVNELLTSGGTHKIVAAILASASLAANGRNHILILANLDSIARHSHYPTDEVFLLPSRVGVPHLYRLACVARHHRVALQLDGIGKNHHVSSLENIAVNPIHYHSVALLQLRGKPSCGHCEDSESVGSDCPC